MHAPAIIALAKRRAREVKVGAVPAVAERGAALVLLDLVVFCYPVDGDGSDVLKSMRCDKIVMERFLPTGFGGPSTSGRGPALKSSTY